jgi:Head domain of trimeric autotransporter adhesin
MKKKLLLLFSPVLFCVHMMSQNVGIGTNAPLARLHVTDSNVLFSASGTVPLIPGNPPVSGAGRRMMWYPDKAAFRAGYVSTDFWDRDSIGNFSFAAGENSKAVGNYSVAFGRQAYALGSLSQAFGRNTTASSNYSMAAGFLAHASGDYSIAFGSNTSAAGLYSIVTGYNSVAAGTAAIAMGYQSNATGNNSVALGEDNSASGANSVSLGTLNTASGISSTALGYSTTASGNYSFATGIGSMAFGNNSFAAGNSVMASNTYAIAFGFETVAAGINSTVMGSFSTASGNNSFAAGDYNVSSGISSAALGLYNKSKSYSGFVVGHYNDSANAASPTSFNSNNRVFQIGNGTADNARSNAITVLQNGNTGINITTPVSLLQVYNGSVLFNGATGTTPVSGAGTRMMWIPAKAAFRAGEVSSSAWDNSNIGSYSNAMGYNSIASGNYSTALGNLTLASGLYSFAMGLESMASGNFSTVWGDNNLASGNYSIASGQITTASGSFSTTFGYFTKASGYSSTAFGNGNVASGDISAAFGIGTKSKSFGGLVAGTYNDSTNAPSTSGWNAANRIFQIGNGTADNARSNAMTVLQNGNVGIGTVWPSQILSVAGSMNVDHNDANSGTVTNSLRFGGGNSGEAIASKRTAGGNQWGLDFYTNSINHMSITPNGEVQVKNNLTVQNGKGLIRSTDGIQQKKQVKIVNINTTFTAGETKAFAFTWSEIFGNAPDAYVGAIAPGSAGGYAEVIMSVAADNTTGGTLFVYNPKSTSVSPNFNVKIIAIGPQ